MADGRAYDKPAVYQIRVKGNLDPRWSDWFDGFVITQQPEGVTLLVGPVADQPALHGLLAKILNLALPLLSVIRQEDQDDSTFRETIFSADNRLWRCCHSEPERSGGEESPRRSTDQVTAGDSSLRSE